jgi:hypothetical protein
MTANIAGVSGFLSNQYERININAKATNHSSELKSSAEVALLQQQLQDRTSARQFRGQQSSSTTRSERRGASAAIRRHRGLRFIRLFGVRHGRGAHCGLPNPKRLGCSPEAKALRDEKPCVIYTKFILGHCEPPLRKF